MVKCSLFLHAVVVIFLIAVTDNLGETRKKIFWFTVEEIQSITVEKTWGQSPPQSRNLNE